MRPINEPKIPVNAYQKTASKLILGRLLTRSPVNRRVCIPVITRFPVSGLLFFMPLVTITVADAVVIAAIKAIIPAIIGKVKSLLLYKIAYIILNILLLYCEKFKRIVT